jgi:hypothetical protein
MLNFDPREEIPTTVPIWVGFWDNETNLENSWTNLRQSQEYLLVPKNMRR